MRGTDGVIATRNHDHVSIFNGDCFINGAVVRVDPLDGKALWRVQSMVIGFLERSLLALGCRIVLMRRVARPMTARSDDLDHK